MAAQPKPHASALLDREKIDNAPEEHAHVAPIPWLGVVGIVPALDAANVNARRWACSISLMMWTCPRLRSCRCSGRRSARTRTEALICR